MLIAGLRRKMNAYCIFCKSGEEQKVARTVQEIVPCETIIPTCAYRFTTRQQEIKQMKAFLPQYLYVYSESNIGKQLHDRKLSGVVRWLGDESNDYVLSGGDYRLAMFLRENEGVIDYQKGHMVNNMLNLMPYGKKYAATGEVLRLDRRKRCMLVRFNFDGANITLWT